MKPLPQEKLALVSSLSRGSLYVTCAASYFLERNTKMSLDADARKKGGWEESPVSCFEILNSAVEIKYQNIK